MDLHEVKWKEKAFEPKARKSRKKVEGVKRCDCDISTFEFCCDNNYRGNSLHYCTKCEIYAEIDDNGREVDRERHRLIDKHDRVCKHGPSTFVPLCKEMIDGKATYKPNVFGEYIYYCEICGVQAAFDKNGNEVHKEGRRKICWSSGVESLI